MPDLSNWGQYGEICNKHEYGRHIALTCKNHPDKRWSTKNIAPIGARNIFYNLTCAKNMGPECDCPATDLIHICEE